MRKFLLLIIVSIIYLSFTIPTYQEDSVDSFKDKLTAIVKKQSKYEFTDDAKDSVSTIIDAALKFYRPGASANNETIVENFHKFLDEMVVYRERNLSAWGNTPMVSKTSVKKARKSICPLYPWCK